MLCTSDRTYNIRSVTLSNSVFVVSPSPDVGASDKQVVIRDSLKELLELVPAVPKVHRMNVLLKEHEWEEGHEEDDENFSKVGTLDISHGPPLAGFREHSVRRNGKYLPSTTPEENFRRARKSSRKHSKRSIYLS